MRRARRYPLIAGEWYLPRIDGTIDTLRVVLSITSLLAACSDPSAAPDANLADGIPSYDIMTWRDQTQMIPDYGPFEPRCVPSSFLAFPKLGECVGASDVENFPCGRPPSNLEHVMLGDVEVQPSPAGAYVRAGSVIGADVTLEGRGYTATFAVAAAELPNATMQTTYDAAAHELRFAWTTDAPAASVLVMLTSSSALLCHTTGSSYAMPLAYEPGYYETYVQAFAPVETHDTPFGEIRVWRSGDIAMQTKPNMP